MQILIVEDDATISGFLAKGFREAGFTADEVADGPGGLDKLLSGHYDVAIVDVMLPGKDGAEVVRAARERGVATLILMLSARASTEDRIRGIEAGADDYVVKPFSFSEVLVRVQALLRRLNRGDPEAAKLAFGDVEMDLIARTARRGDRELDLRPREFALLAFLLRNPGRIVSKTAILSEVYGYGFDPQTNVVDVLVHRLRQKLDKGHEQKLIHTVRGAGYVLRT
jgi:two-component system OmpR family response regulator